MGRPAPSVPLNLIDEEGRECAIGAEGNIAVLIEKNGGGEFFGLYVIYLQISIS
jgi:hypothetical protein